MKKLLACTAILALAACGSQESSEPAPVETPLAVVDPEPSLPSPTTEVFAAAYAEACPDAKPVSTALCKSFGLGKEGFTCDYGVGEDDRQPFTASIVPGEGKWAIADPETTCTAAEAA